MDYRIEGVCPVCKAKCVTIATAADDGLEPVVLCPNHSDNPTAIDIQKMDQVSSSNVGISTTFTKRHPTR